MPRSGTGRRLQLYDATRSRVIRAVTEDEFNQMVAQGLVGWFERNGKHCRCLQPLPMQSRTSAPLRSRVSLIGTDSELNAEGAFADKAGYGGIRKFGRNRFGVVDEAIVGNRIDQSMTKVEQWPSVFDQKNVTVCAGRVHGVTVAELPVD